MHRAPTISIRKWRVQHHQVANQSQTDVVAVEEPLEILVRTPTQHHSLGITLRTPGDEAALAVGLAFFERLLVSEEDLEGVELPEPNRVVVVLRRDPMTFPQYRQQYRSAACGLCGSEMIHEALSTGGTPLHQLKCSISIDSVIIDRIYQQGRDFQRLFPLTGGTHSASLFTLQGEHVQTCEDIGRHNAVDKLIGTLILQRKLECAARSILLLSGRAGFELVHKAVRAGIPVVCSVGAPSSLAIQLAATVGMLLIGFYHQQTFNVYTGVECLQR